MNWDKFDIHLENLIPGLALATILLIYWSDMVDVSDENKTLIATGFIATSYLAGAVANIIARILLVPISSWLLRVPFIRLFAKNKISHINVKTKQSLNKLYSQYIDDAMLCGNDNVIKEILKRLQTARLCRSALLPILFIIVTKFISANPISYIWLIVSIITAYFFVLILYAYSEVTIFSEASRGHRILNLHNSKADDNKDSNA